MQALEQRNRSTVAVADLLKGICYSGVFEGHGEQPRPTTTTSIDRRAGQHMPGKTPPRLDEWAEYLWTSFAMCYESRWLSKYGTKWDGSTPESVAWRELLSRLDGQQVVNAVRAYRLRSAHEPWPPAMMEFHRTALGIPGRDTFVTGWIDSDPSVTSTPFAHFVYRRLGPSWSWTARHASRETVERALQQAYGRAVESVLDGEPMPEVNETAGQLAPGTGSGEDTLTAERRFAEHMISLGQWSQDDAQAYFQNAGNRQAQSSPAAVMARLQKQLGIRP